MSGTYEMMAELGETFQALDVTSVGLRITQALIEASMKFVAV